MAEPISEDLGFDISGALQGIGQIDDALQQVVQQFSVGLATALEQLIGVGADVTPLAESLDVAGLGPAIDTALADARSGVIVPVEADTSAVGPEIADAVDQPQTVPVDADTAEAQTAIGDLDQPVVLPVDADTASAQAAVDEVAAAPITVPVDADTTEAESAIGALEVTPQTIPVDADTSDAADAIAALGTETPVTVPVDGDTAGLSDAIETATAVTPVIPVDADVTDAQAQIDALAAVPVDVPVAADTGAAQDAIDQLGLAAPIDIPVTADTSQAETDIAQLGGDITVPVDADTAGAEAQIAGLGDPITVPVEGDTADLSDAIDTATQVSATIPVDADTSQAEQSIEALATVPPVDVPVSADTAGAEAEIEQLGLGVSVDVPVSADTSAAESEIAGLGAGAEVTVPVDADTSALSDAIDSAALVSPVIPLEGDAAGLTEAIDTATAVSPVIDVSADTSEAQAAIDALAATPIDLPIAVDTAEAQAAIDDLGASATGATGGGSSGLAGLEGAVLGVKAATGAATGDFSGLTGVIGGLSSGLGEAAIGGAAFGAFIGETTKLAADAEAQQKRFNDTFGASAAIVKNIDVGGLNISLEELGKQSGTATANLEASASRIGLLGTSSGVAQPKVAKVTQEILGLGATLSVNNPRLGDASVVADRLFTALTRGGRAAQQLGLNVPTKQIQALAQEIAGAGNEVSQFDKLQAGLQLALAGFGDTLGGKFADGAQNAQVQLRALKVELEETLVAIGGPLLQPVVESLKSVLPVAQQLGIALGKLGEAILPLVNDLTPALTPVAAVLGLIGDGLGVVADAIGLIPPPVIQALAVGFVGLGIAIDAAAGQLGIFGISLDLALGPIGLALAALTALGLAFHVFGGGSKDAATDTTALNAAFSTTSESAAGFQSVLDSLNQSIADYLKSTLSAGKDGKTGLDTANALGVGYAELSRALSGTDEQYQTFRDNLESSNAAQNLSSDQSRKFFDILEEGRGTLEDNARAALAGAVADGVLTQAQLDQANAAHSATGFNDDYGNKIVDNIGVLRDLAPAIDAATQATNKGAAAASTASPAYAQLVRSLATGAITTDTFTSSLAQFGFVGDGAATQAKAVSDALSSLISSAEGALPTVGGAIDAFAATVKKDMQQIADDTAQGTGDVQADLKKLADDSDPQRFAENLNTQTVNILTFTANLASLVNQGFGTLAASLALKGPEAAGALAASLASAPAKAKVAQKAEELSAEAGSQLDAFLRAKFPQLEGLGVEAGGTITDGIASGVTAGAPGVNGAIDGLATAASEHFHPNFSNRVAIEIQAAAVALTNDPSISQAAGDKGLQVLAAFEQTYGPVSNAQAIRVALGGARDALANDPSLATAAGQKGAGATDAFGKNLKLSDKSAQALTAAGLTISDQTFVISSAGVLGVETGEAFGQGFANGLDSKAGAIVDAASAVAALADSTMRHRLGIRSPSSVGEDIGSQFVAGIVQGLERLDPLHRATAALALALVPDLRPAIRQVPSLAPAISAAASHAVAAPAVVSTPPGATAGTTRKDVNVKVDLHKVDVNPKLLADEIAWTIG